MRVYLAAAGLMAAGIITVMAGEKPPADYVKVMKDTKTAAPALRGHVTAKDYDAVAADAASLKTYFADTEKFWTARKTEDAIGFSKTGAKAAADLETAAKAKNDDGIAAAARGLTGTCQGCHPAHR